MSSANVRRWLFHYAYGCFAKSWNGAIAAAYAVLGQALGSLMDPTYIQVPTWRTAAYVFGVSFVITAFGYFKDNPLPNHLEQPKQENNSP